MQTQAIIPRSANSSLSFAQQRIWSLEQGGQQGSRHNLPFALILTGPLDPGLLGLSIGEIVRRHEILRTTFAEAGGEPVPRVAAALELPIEQVEFPVGAASAAMETLGEAGMELKRQVVALARRPFDLAQGPLLRVTLFSLGGEKHLLLVVLHRLVADAWSVGVFHRELAALYRAFSQGRPAPLPDLPIQYRDFAAWQRGRFQGEFLERELEYWKKRLDSTPVPSLPTDRPRPQVQTTRGASIASVLPGAVHQALRQLAEREGAATSVVLLAAFQLLLHRYTGHDDIAVGAPVANRERPELQGMIGNLASTLVLRSDLGGDPSFGELLGRVRQVVLEARSHQELPFEMLVQELHPQGDPSHTPLFQVMLMASDLPDLLPEFPGLAVEPFALGTETAEFDLTLSLGEDQGELAGVWEYNADLFDAATVERMAGHFRVLLEGIAADPDRRLSELPLLTEAERRQVLVEWNDTAKLYPRTCLHRLFEAQVERTPDAEALVFEDKHLSYRELNLRTNQLASHLRKLGIGPDSLVGVYMERSLEMVVALMGILKAGGAYLPLDPAYPGERLAYMLELSRTPVILTQCRLSRSVPASGARTLCLDGEWQTISQEPAENPLGGAAPENLAYVLFTSGSTGRPKGVEITHAGICNRLIWMQEYYGFDPTERILQKTPFSFDVSLWEFFLPLISGGALVVARPDGHRDSRYLVEIIRQQRITSLHFVPSMLQLFLDEEGANAPSLRRVICSGEALPYELKRRFQACMSAELHNLYGPTEASVDVTAWDCAPELPADTVPIGRPIANIQLYILDRHLQPVPIGVPGELHIGGVGVARGYLNKPELTEARFIPDPFSVVPGSRLYKTGDLVRYLPDGNIVYLGRLDNQVKIRGNRVELAEIESVLGRLAEVKENVVVARTDPSGNNSLAAYLVLKPGCEVTTAKMRAFLKENVPEYMVPSAFVYLDALPLNSNGKVDRKALPEPVQHTSAEEAALKVPLSDLEQGLVQLWEELLDVRPVGVRDNFFDLGGHSIMAIRLFGLIEHRFGIRLSPSVLFHSPTITELSEIIRRGVKADSHVRLVPISPEGSRPPLFCISPVNHSALCFREITKDLDSSQPVYGIEGTDQILQAPLEQAAADFARVMLDTTPQGPFCLLGYSAGGVIAFEAARQLREKGRQVDFLGMLDSNNPLRPTPLGNLLARVRRFYRVKGNRMSRLWRAICPGADAPPPPVETVDEAELRTREFFARVRDWQLDYTPRPFPGRVVYFEAEHPPEERATDGWRRFIDELEVHPLPGDHAQLVAAPPVAKAIGAIVAAHLSRISG